MVEQGCRAELIEDGRLIMLTLSNVPANHITPDILNAIGRTLDDTENQPLLRAVVLQGEGNVFSKGFDARVIEDFATAAEHRRSLLIGNDVCSRIAASRLPWIAAINGHCLGGGLELALACHFRLGMEGARLGLPELSRGLLPGLGGIHRLTKLIGRAKALELIMGGVLVNGDEALQMGLINRSIPKTSFAEGVMSFSRNLISNDRGLVADVMSITAAAEQSGDQDRVVETIECVLQHWQPREKR